MHQMAKKRCPRVSSSLLFCVYFIMLCVFSDASVVSSALLFSTLWFVFLLLDFAFLVHDTYVGARSIRVRSPYECFLYFDLLFFSVVSFFLSLLALHLQCWPFFGQFVLLSVRTGTNIHLSFYISFHSDIFDWFSSSSCIQLWTHFVSFWWQSNKKSKTGLSVPSDLCRAVDCHTYHVMLWCACAMLGCECQAYTIYNFIDFFHAWRPYSNSIFRVPTSHPFFGTQKSGFCYEWLL